ncbi:MAG: hypothetical protein MRERC_3c148 [Mycoplasmataceae bacterium RC_NB112A]|nr:MAG: hypothetical protein MRERC_3c148 [Mycoplasmataceae bacterium RC_NB112A]
MKDSNEKHKKINKKTLESVINASIGLLKSLTLSQEQVSKKIVNFENKNQKIYQSNVKVKIIKEVEQLLNDLKKTAVKLEEIIDKVKEVQTQEDLDRIYTFQAKDSGSTWDKETQTETSKKGKIKETKKLKKTTLTSIINEIGESRTETELEKLYNKAKSSDFYGDYNRFENRNSILLIDDKYYETSDKFNKEIRDLTLPLVKNLAQARTTKDLVAIYNRIKNSKSYQPNNARLIDREYETLLGELKEREQEIIKASSNAREIVEEMKNTKTWDELIEVHSKYQLSIIYQKNFDLMEKLYDWLTSMHALFEESSREKSSTSAFPIIKVMEKVQTKDDLKKLYDKIQFSKIYQNNDYNAELIDRQYKAIFNKFIK